MRIPIEYLASFLSAGDPEPVRRSLSRMAAMRRFMRAADVDGVDTVATDVGMEPAEMEEMFRMVAIGDYDDRYVVPKRHGEVSPDAFAEQGSCGIDFVNGAAAPRADVDPGLRHQGPPRHPQREDGGQREPVSPLKLASVLLQYPDAERREAAAAARELEIAPARGRQVERLRALRLVLRDPGPRAPAPLRRGVRLQQQCSLPSPITSTATAASAAWRCSASRGLSGRGPQAPGHRAARLPAADARVRDAGARGGD